MKDFIKNSKKFMLPYVLVILILVIIFLLFKDKLLTLFNNPDQIKEYISRFGVYGPIITILLVVMQVILFFIPGAIFYVAAGYVFGTFWGALYSWIGLIIGSSIIFLVGRKLGRPFVKKIIKKESLDEFDNFFSDRVLVALLISRAIPIGFPSDVASLAISLTRIKFISYLIITAIGYIPHVIIISYFGNQMVEGFTYKSLLIFSIIGFLLLAYILYKPIKQSIEHKKHKKEDYYYSEGNFVQKLIDECDIPKSKKTLMK